ncbi:GNAT family N-acetyltransferase [Tamlana sp. 2201CG12-4]|uniref:GNAT family N-acetyltransferase n=1 Tax=Tamlana sp. 2201CG12-4 TaxID=3112582 RepID=UPI002DBA4206|nr:GNAT family N-acetyltransferase [Tamlana sp. 2201CG12-4]MEC3908032.1 GNAT family N-acetyltransferase [Tamlana sp. 2201CG12-4]
MKGNPFLSETFKTIWLNHFNCNKAYFIFGIIPKLEFVKNKYLPVFYNIGKTNTKGISYDLSEAVDDKDCKGRVFIIYDVANHTKMNTISNQANLKSRKIVQYPGFRCMLNKYNSLDAYMSDALSRKSRYKFRSYRKKIENAFGARYKVYFGEISNEDYKFIFSYFKTLLKKRFFKKKTVNNNLTFKEWEFYKEVTLPMIRKKEAALFVMYDKGKPIAITLTNFSENIMYDVIRVFDIDYARYRPGTIGIMKQLEWCIEHKLRALDFAKGYFEYKKRWANQIYWLEYHIYYDKKSFLSCTLALIYSKFYDLKLFLRRHDLINFAHKLSFIKNKKKI